MDVWSMGIWTLSRRIFDLTPDLQAPERLSLDKEAIDNCDVPREVIDKVVRDEQGKEALANLGIDPDDNEYLSEILDPDHGGTVTLHDLVDGIRRLRGDPRRSDIVHVNMMVRAT